MKTQDDCQLEEEIGDLLFSVVNVSRLLNVNAEEALKKATHKFIRRFSLVEEETKKQGKEMDKLSLLELDEIWDSIKHND